MESMRAVGYTLETAIADLVDNSISASASYVRISFASEPLAYVAIVDDGAGMSAEEARHAMKLAGRNPSLLRKSTDLGRFGLGLKTASLSQCRDLTLISKTADGTIGLRWNLDHLAQSGRWSLLVLSDEEIAVLPHAADLEFLESGTLVLWRELDRMSATLGNSGRSLDAQMVRVNQHLSLVFHRFLSGEHGQQLDIAVNGVSLPRTDPFLSSHRATQIGPLESFSIEGARIELRSYTLPFLNKLSRRDLERAQVAGSLRESQGFYIYRAMRLVIWGTWFRIVPKNELGKLARVKVDIPNTLDHLWALDIKKSAAVPPPIVRAELRRIVDKIVGPSRSAHVYRGRIESNLDDVVRMWRLIKDRGSFRYEINRGHPIVKVLGDQLDPSALESLERVLTLLEESFPIEDVYNRLAEDESHNSNEQDEAALLTLARGVWGVQSAAGGTVEDFIESFARSEPFNRARNAHELLRKATCS
ncbi:ATP-binding protein [Leifsonia sp. A12D58]|uniref:ATP-binding protein n=1 Tax=Leifsonia sp. A12D58 TaxID=3397674 RepID=UPI0039DF3017